MAVGLGLGLGLGVRLGLEVSVGVGELDQPAHPALSPERVPEGGVALLHAPEMQGDAGRYREIYGDIEEV